MNIGVYGCWGSDFRLFVLLGMFINHSDYTRYQTFCYPLLNQVRDNGIITREVLISESVFVHSAIPCQSYCPGLELKRDTGDCEKLDSNPLAGCT